MKTPFKLVLFSLLFFSTINTALALSGDISINTQDIRFSTDIFLEGRTIRIYATAKNNSTEDLLGTVRYYDNDKQIGGDQPISIFAGKNDGVFIDWTPHYGSHKIAVKIFPWKADIDDPSNNWIVSNVNVQQDTDHDGKTNAQDLDDDNDNIPDLEDFAPLDSKEQYDTDGDGKGNSIDEDDDNDGVPDKADDLPLDTQETTDTDKDGIGNIADPDDDNDLIPDIEEEKTGTNSLNTDSDNDTASDYHDAFPLNQNEQIDTDKDDIGDNTDIDDDNDGLNDPDDKFPKNKGPVISLDDKEINTDILEEKNFDASDSYDDDGEIVSYIWDIDGKITKEGNAITHRFSEFGLHNIKLTVTDDKGESRTSDVSINVINIGLYKEIIISLIAILLASLVYFKYIAAAKKKEEPKNP